MSTLTDRSTSSAPLSHLAYAQIQRLLVDQRWDAKARISEQQLASDLGISRTPVREAIQRLVSEGILYQVPSSGTYVSQPDRRQIVELFEVRQALEGLSAAKAANQIQRADVRKLQEHIDAMLQAARDFQTSGERYMTGQPLARFLTADMAFHTLLLQVSGNRLALKYVTEGNVRGRVFGIKSYERDIEHVSKVWLVHARIARAVRRHEADDAKYWMERHVQNSLRATLVAYDHQQAERNSWTPGIAEAEESTQTILEALAHPLGAKELVNIRRSRPSRHRTNTGSGEAK